MSEEDLYETLSILFREGRDILTAKQILDIARALLLTETLNDDR